MKLKPWKPKTARKSDGPACVICGCVESNACEGGCYWAQADPPVCSRCCGVLEPFEVDAAGDVVGPGPEQGMEGRPFVLDGTEEPAELCAALNRAFSMGWAAAVATGATERGRK